ncbi:MAG TPA: hypothetical protein VFY99_03265 [Solirubrobacterales bacterium]
MSGGRDPGTAPGAAFYCVADERYFVGAVSLVNSLRLLGHREPIHVLDCGLTEPQRELLAAQATLHSARGDSPPWLLKTEAPLAAPAEAMILLDTDMVATRSLRPLAERAVEGRIVVFANPVQRRTDGWGELLGLGPMRGMPYVSSAAIAAEGELGGRILNLLSDLQGHVDFDRTWWRAGESDYPWLYADQDILNAILATRVDEDRIDVLDEQLAPTPPFSGLRLLDEQGLRCAYADGTEPYLVHHHVVKPWLQPTHHGIYSRLMRRLLIGPDLAIRVPEAEIPPHMRGGIRAWALRARVNARERVRWHVREPLAARVRGRGADGRKG